MRIDPDSSSAWLFRTLSWTSPAWPIGAFAYSSGQEWAVEAAWVRTGADVRNWLQESLSVGQLNADAMIFSSCWTAIAEGQSDKINGMAELVLAAQTTEERSLESCAQGSAFRRIAIRANQESHAEAIERYAGILESIDGDSLPYAIAAGALFGSFGIPLQPATTAFLHGALSNLLSAAQRIVPLGHSDTQQLLASLEPALSATVARAIESADAELCDVLHSATYAADVAAILHETQYTRLYRS